MKSYEDDSDTSSTDTTESSDSDDDVVDLSELSSEALKSYQHEVDSGTKYNAALSTSSNLYSNLIGNSSSSATSVSGISSNIILSAYQAQTILSL